MTLRGPMHALGQLTDRDHAILDWLYDHKIMTTAQLARALFPSLDTAQDRLRKLYLLGLLDRGRMYREGGGKHSWRYMLDQDGWAIVAAYRGDDPPPRRDKIRTRNLRLVQSPKTEHLLGVNSFFTDLAGYARTHDGAELRRWWSEAQIAGLSPVTLATPGPLARPDGHGIFTDAGRTVAFFLEYDTGTEPLQKLVDKVDGYAMLHRSGLRWPVLFWLHSSAREQNLHRRLPAILRAAVATAARDRAARVGETPADALWLVHGERTGRRVQLVEVPCGNVPQ
ncbi:MAG TPA: replication-relaxation family protein [Micromonosporaceae bacterium]|nr:replication-relaxation family protein [Micromonosporaceae bacterium]